MLHRRRYSTSMTKVARGAWTGATRPIGEQARRAHEVNIVRIEFGDKT